MPTLPGKELSDEHFDRVVRTFPGATMAEKAAAYDQWLTGLLIDRVLLVESAQLDAAVEVERQRLRQRIVDSLPPRPPLVGMPPVPSEAVVVDEGSLPDVAVDPLPVPPVQPTPRPV